MLKGHHGCCCVRARLEVKDACRAAGCARKWPGPEGEHEISRAALEQELQFPGVGDNFDAGEEPCGGRQVGERAPTEHLNRSRVPETDLQQQQLGQPGELRWFTPEVQLRLLRAVKLYPDQAGQPRQEGWFPSRRAAADHEVRALVRKPQPQVYPGG